MQLKEIMTDKVVYVSPDTPVEQVAKLMSKHNIGSVPVCDETGVKGIITDRDIVLRTVADGTNPKVSKACDIMTPQVTTANPSMDVREASKVMAQQQIRRLPVVDNNKLVGMVSLGDLAVNPSFDIEASEALSDISAPSHPNQL